MAENPPIRIGLAGFGVVGQGVWKHLEANRTNLTRRLQGDYEITRVAVRDLHRPREVTVPTEKLSTDPMAVATDPDIHILCELMGGTTLAKDVTLAALQTGKTVVTANKALICDHGEELFAAARKGGGHYFFEASVGGGIPIIKVLREGLVANRFPLIYGVLNGTCNYILTRMRDEAQGFEPIVADARRLGYVEADESLDLDGWDTAHKAVILAFLAHGKWVPLSEVVVEGIRRVSLDDIGFAETLGCKVKLLAVIERDPTSDALAVSVRPTLIRQDDTLASVDGVYNGASILGDVVGRTLLTGRGAGQDATASAVISDVADAILALRGGPDPVISEEDTDYYQALGEGVQLASPEKIRRRFYVRLRVEDRPGVLADAARTFADHGISLASVIQPAEEETAHAALIVTTHTTNEAAMNATTRALRELPAVREDPLVFPMVDFGEG